MKSCHEMSANEFGASTRDRGADCVVSHHFLASELHLFAAILPPRPNPTPQKTFDTHERFGTPLTRPPPPPTHPIE